MKQLLLLVYLVLIAGIGFALDDEGNPTDPTDNERANACFEGGSMEGKCDTEWEWQAGWFLVRFEYGMFSREDIPVQYSILLPPPAEGESVEYSNDGCAYADTNKWCISGNYVWLAELDLVPVDPSTKDYYIIADPNVGVGVGCPNGTVFENDVSEAGIGVDELVSGFASTDNFCEIY